MTQSFRHTKADWPIALDELKARRDQCLKAESRASIFFLVVFFGFLFANIPFADWMDHSGEAPKWLGPVWLGVFFAILLANVPLMIHRVKKRQRSFDLVCPACEKLLNPQLMAVAVATGHCGHCGAQLVSNHPFKTKELNPAHWR